MSKHPGRTREANFFRINDSFYFADFPGYGYAKRSILKRNKMIKRIFWYVEFSNARPEAVFLIIDANVGLTALDRDMIKILEANKHQIEAPMVLCRSKRESRVSAPGNRRVDGYSVVFPSK